MKLLRVCFWLWVTATSHFLTVRSQGEAYDRVYLEGGPLFNIAWLTVDAMESSQTNPPGEPPTEEASVDILPNRLLGEGEGKGESLLITSANQEQYTCLLPDTSDSQSDSVSGCGLTWAVECQREVHAHTVTKPHPQICIAHDTIGLLLDVNLTLSTFHTCRVVQTKHRQS